MAEEAVIIFGFIFVWMLFVVAAILGFVFWIFMLIDCAERKFKKNDDKVVWIIILALTGVLGAAIYYFAVRQKYKGKKQIASKATKKPKK